MTPPTEPQSVALELADMRGALEVGLARIDGKLALIAQRTDQTDKALGEHRDLLAAHGRRIGDVEQAVAVTADHEPRLGAVERRVWFAVGAGTVLGTLGGYLVAFLQP
jgi:hypothetical protein